MFPHTLYETALYPVDFTRFVCHQSVLGYYFRGNVPQKKMEDNFQETSVTFLLNQVTNSISHHVIPSYYVIYRQRPQLLCGMSEMIANCVTDTA